LISYLCKAEAKLAQFALVSARGVDGEILTKISLPLRQVLCVLLVCAGYYSGALIGQSLRFPNSHLSLIWPPTAILLAALMLAPPRRWWIFLVAVCPVHIFVQSQDGVPALGILSQLTGNFGQAVIAAATTRYFDESEIRLDGFHNVIIFTLCAVILAPVFVSAGAAYLYVLSGWEHDYWYAWRARVLSNSLSTLTIVPLILTAFAGAIAQMQSAPPRRYLELGLLMTGLVLVGFFALGRQADPTLLYAPLPFLLWAAVRFEIGTLCLALLLAAYLIFVNTSGGHGPFAMQSAAENALSVQLFLITISLPLIFLAALTSERREKEQALGRSEARYRALVMTSAEIVWRANAQGEAFFVTPSWQQLTGQSDEEMRKFGWLQALHPDDRESSARLWQQAMSEKRVFENEFRVRTRGGSYRYFHVQAVPIVAPDGTVQEWVGANTDITDRKEAALSAQRHRDELAHVSRISTMGELAASLAHELNQPLTAILSNTQAAQRLLAMDHSDIDEVREILKDIVHDDNRAGEVIRRLRAMVKKERLDFAPLILANVIEDVVVLLHSDAILHNVRVLVEFDAELPRVRGDRIQLQQVVMNLLLNAFDAMKDCPVHERVVIVRGELDGADSVKVAVCDRGIGLGSEQQKVEQMFQPFYTTKRDGLGMGLSISRSIIEAHGGRLWADNNPHRGATFFFTASVEKSVEGERSSGNSPAVRANRL
jgi:PAS domain S-box-containing protein